MRERESEREREREREREAGAATVLLRNRQIHTIVGLKRDLL